jgi:hypothetical protein
MADADDAGVEDVRLAYGASSSLPGSDVFDCRTPEGPSEGSTTGGPRRLVTRVRIGSIGARWDGSENLTRDRHDCVLHDAPPAESSSDVCVRPCGAIGRPRLEGPRLHRPGDRSVVEEESTSTMRMAWTVAGSRRSTARPSDVVVELEPSQRETLAW